MKKDRKLLELFIKDYNKIRYNNVIHDGKFLWLYKFSDELLIEMILRTNIESISIDNRFKHLYTNVKFIEACINTSKFIPTESYPVIVDDWNLLEIYTKWSIPFCKYLLNNKDELIKVLTCYHSINNIDYYKMIKNTLSFIYNFQYNTSYTIDIINNALLDVDPPEVKFIVTTDNKELKQKLKDKGYYVRVLTINRKIYTDTYETELNILNDKLYNSFNPMNNNKYKIPYIKKIFNIIKYYCSYNASDELIEMLHNMYKSSKSNKFKKEIIEYCKMIHDEIGDIGYIYKRIVNKLQLTAIDIDNILYFYPEFIKYVPNHKINKRSFNYDGTLLKYIDINKLSVAVLSSIIIKLHNVILNYNLDLSDKVIKHVLNKKPILYYLFDKIKYKQYFIDNIKKFKLWDKKYINPSIFPDMKEVYKFKDVQDAIIENNHYSIDYIEKYIKDDYQIALKIYSKDPTKIELFNEDIQNMFKNNNYLEIQSHQHKPKSARF